MEIFAPYTHAIATLGLWGLWMVCLSMQSNKSLTPKHRINRKRTGLIGAAAVE